MSRLRSEDTPRSSRARVVRHDSPLGWWEMARGAPAPALAGIVRGYCGWREHTAARLVRIEPPSSDVPLILLFESPVLAIDPDAPGRTAAFGSFIAGLYDRYTLVGSQGPMAGVQVNLSPIGARLLLDRPMVEFANRMVNLDDVWGAEGKRLTARLAEAPDWEGCFDILDREIGARVSAARPTHPNVTWAMKTLMATSGQVRIARLVKETGWSARHLAARVQAEFGLPPKTMARVLRLGRAVETLRREGVIRLAEVAADCGYYDQAHFSRDFRQFTGLTPTEFLRSRLPDAGGIAVTR
ncbi:MAG: helix-turn-helix domain-containing protein [Vicinamibacterales bacterium]